MNVLDPDRVLDALTGRMTGQELAQRLGESSRDVLPVLNGLCADGLVSRTVTDQSVVRFSPLVNAAGHQLPSALPPLAVAA